MTLILAIDAAWTATEPSGLALVASDPGAWQCLAVAPSYDAFLAVAAGTPVDWDQPGFPGSVADVPQLLAAACSLAGRSVDLVTIDMPVATVPMTGRRAGDDDISREFGGRACSTHTANANRPGPLGAALSAAFEKAGLPIATKGTIAGTSHRLVEVYPHPALLALLGRPYRVPYKVAKARRYWPALTSAHRITALLAEFQAIHQALAGVFSGIVLPLPTPDQVASPRRLKPYEDALDALVCAWVGVCYVRGSALAYGDATAAIWCPDVVRRLPALVA